jgi:hypothetical protein
MLAVRCSSNQSFLSYYNFSRHFKDVSVYPILRNIFFSRTLNEAMFVFSVEATIYFTSG